MKLTAPRMLAMPVRVRPTIQRSVPVVDENGRRDSGG
jgi:hypothetical protein